MRRVTTLVIDGFAWLLAAERDRYIRRKSSKICDQLRAINKHRGSGTFTLFLGVVFQAFVSLCFVHDSIQIFIVLR